MSRRPVEYNLAAPSTAPRPERYHPGQDEPPIDTASAALRSSHARARRRALLGLAAWWALAVGAAALSRSPGDPLVAAAGSLLALVVLPGLALSRCLPWGVERPGLGMLTLAAGATGAAWLVVVALLLVLGGPGLGPPLLGLSLAVALGLPTLFAARGQAPLPRPATCRAELVRLGLILAVAAPLRFVNLGYAELQGDETEVVLRAMALVQGRPDALFYHGKGPAELLVTAAPYALADHVSEASARLPFALFNVVGILGLAALVAGWFGLLAGLAAGLLLAANGYFVAFAHIAQYQSLVFLFSVAALACAERYRAGVGRIGRWAILSGLLVGVGTLAHYDALFGGLFAALLLAAGLGRSPAAWRRALPGLALAALVGLLALLLFFGPYLASPLFALATDRVSGRVGDDFPRDNLPVIVPAASLYLSAYYAVALLSLAALGLVLGLCWPGSGPHPPPPSPARRGGVFPGRACFPPRAGEGPGVGSGTRHPGLAGEEIPVSRRHLTLLVAIWAAVPLFAYIAVVRKPGTHIHVGLEGLAVLAAVGLAALLELPRRRPIRAALGGLALLALGPVLAYHATFFLQTSPEVVRDGLARRYPLYWKPGDLVPRKERFGFPYQAGWKAVGVLFADGTLQGSYDSNENEQITHWYTRDAWRCTDEPRYYLIGEAVQDEIEPPRKKIAAEYTLVADVTVQGRPRLHVYDLHPDRSGPPTVYAAEDLGPRFDQLLSIPTIDPGPWGRGPVAARFEPVGADFGDARLLGYRLYVEDPRPGGRVRLDLYWLPLVDGGGHEASVRLGRDTLVGEGNGPGCDHSDSWKEWQAGRPFVRRHSVDLTESAAPGRYPLLVSLYAKTDNRALPVVAGPGRGDTSVEIAEVEIGGR